MKIGIYISPSHAVPPNEKNILAPWMLTAQLADGLVDKGHEVTLFAAKGSKTKAKLIHGNIPPAAEKMQGFGDHTSYQAFVASQNLVLMREAVSFVKSVHLDVLHIHTAPEGLYPALLALPAHLPVVVTFHDPIVAERFPALEKVYALGMMHFVSLSHAQQEGVPFPFVGVVPNGVDTKLFVPDGDLPIVKRPLLITGRIVPQKGFSDAIEAAREADERLMIVGQRYDMLPDANDYFDTKVAPFIDGKMVMWESVVKQEHLVGHYQTAKALLFPIHWEEPFGLVMIEAMACGTPVVAYNRGSVPEILVDGKTGFIVDPQKGVDGLVASIKRIGAIDRTVCRRHVEEHFSLKTMIGGYENVYQKLLAK